MNSKCSIYFLVGFLFLWQFTSCKKDPPPTVPILSTSEISEITEASAKTGGDITSSGGADIIERGICWDIAPNPTINGSKLSSSNGIGPFIVTLSNLSPNTKYYIKAYATNSVGTSYGDQLTFTTNTALAVLSTSEISLISSSGAKSGGIITNNGGGDIISRGLCWSKTPNPTIQNEKISSGTGIGAFEAVITGLTYFTKYYVRAYATNQAGTVYGNELSFTTLQILPVLSTSEVSSISSSGAKSGGIITNNGGDDNVSRGLCWSTTLNPTIQNEKISSGTGIGTFEAVLTGLTYFTKYYVRAYATNQAGTAYGNELSFTTLPTLPSLGEFSIANIGTLTTKASVNVLNDGGASVSTRGFCWSTSPNPTIQDNLSSVNSGTGVFDLNITGLNPGTVYHVRAYATNIAGTAYSNDLDFITDLIDIDGNVYDILKFGTQYWMQSNLKTKHFSNGESIPTGPISVIDWKALSTPAYSWYIFSGYTEETFKNIYGLYYNWYAVSDNRNICPAGWHVPTDDEWTILANSLGGADVAGGKMKTTGTIANGDGLWIVPNTGATNSSNFSALPSAGRTSGGVWTIGSTAYWWTSTPATSSLVWIRYIDTSFAGLVRESNVGEKFNGYAVRCLKN